MVEMLAVAPIAVFAPFAVAPNASSMPVEMPELTLGGRLSDVMLEGGFSTATAMTNVAADEKGAQLIIDEQPIIIRFHISKVEDAPILSAPALSTCQRLDAIKSRLGISVTQLADLLGVTRKAIYDWYDGAEPRAAMIGRISSLLEAIARFEDSDLKRLKVVWSIGTPAGSFRSTLQNDRLVGSELTAALVAKLNELSEEMAASPTSPRRSAVHIGSANLADIDRHSDSF